jgi:hypothetical protein
MLPQCGDDAITTQVRLAASREVITERTMIEG